MSEYKNLIFYALITVHAVSKDGDYIKKLAIDGFKQSMKKRFALDVKCSYVFTKIVKKHRHVFDTVTAYSVNNLFYDGSSPEKATLVRICFTMSRRDINFMKIKASPYYNDIINNEFRNKVFYHVTI